ncbi:MAG: twin-arginine translocase subunit TatC [Succinivibrio sp.]
MKNSNPFLENLCAFRRMLVLSIIGFVICTLSLLPFTKRIFDFISEPLLMSMSQGSQFLSVSVVSPVMAPLKVVLFLAFILSLPNTLYQIWKFTAPALYKREQKTAAVFVISSIIMFFLGVLYCYFAVFGTVFSFIATYAPESVNFSPDIDAYISFILRLYIAFGIAFLTPVIVIVALKLGITDLNRVRKSRRYVIVAAFAVAAVITPPDVVSQLLLAMPLIILYEAGILAAGLLSAKSSKERAFDSFKAHS